MASITDSRVLRSGKLADMLGVSRVTLWRWERKGLLPKRTHYGPNCCGWTSSQIEEWWKQKSGTEIGLETK